MSKTTIYKFEAEGKGTLELEIVNSNRSFYQPSHLDDIPFTAKGLESSSARPEPFFFYEWQKFQYTYVIDANSDYKPPFEIRVNNKTLKKSKEFSNTHLLTGQYSFDDQVGETTIQIRDYSNRLIFELCTEVFPQKMDYKSDYKAMMADISSIIQNLAFDTLKDTFRRGKARKSGQSTESEWWSILDALFDQFVVNLGVIKRQPKHEIRTIEKLQSVEKIKNSSKKNVDWFRKNARFSNTYGSGVKVAFDKHYSHALSTRKYVTYDTYENRFIAWAVKNIIEQLRHYSKRIELSTRSGDFSSLTRKIKTYQGRLQSILHESPFDEVGVFEKRSQFSTSLTRGAGYRDFMHIYLLLTRGLELADNEIFKIDQKNISTLYEFWCFLALIKIAKEEMNLNVTYNDLIKIKSSKIKVDLQKGNTSEIRFSNEDRDEELSIYYNKEFTKDGKRIFTYNQIPDIALKFTKKGFKKPFWYVFDAKYRFDEKGDDGLPAGKQEYNVPQDAIGQLHRYRDAILHSEPDTGTYRGAIKNLGGIILYPYPKSEKEFEENTFYSSIEQVNIGALPFLPSKSSLVSVLLNRLINKTSPEEHYEQFIEMDKSEYTKQRREWRDLVTIGSIPKENQEERMKFLSEKLIYHVPFVKNLNSKIYLSKKILVCIAGTKNATLYDVKHWEVLTDKELNTLGTTWFHRAQKYISFHLSNGKEIITPEKLSPQKFRYATEKGLTEYLNNPDTGKGYFYLTNPDSARLYNELKALDIDFNIKWADTENDPSLIKFILNEMVVYSSDKYDFLQFMVDGENMSLKVLLERVKL